MARSKSNPQIVLRPQDLVVLLRLALEHGPAPSYAALGSELGMTASEVHAAVERAVSAQLAQKDSGGKATVLRSALRPFLQHGARYCFPATRGSLTRGVPTGYAAAPLKDSIRPGSDPLPVWPSKNGTVRGMALYPLYPTVPEAALRNPALYELLALFDAVRDGNARERALAGKFLEQRLQS
ncbi:MAG: MarR family transcriptional regulator [Dokdonella sp.]